MAPGAEAVNINPTANSAGRWNNFASRKAPNGITVNALLPGTHQTSRIDQLAKDRSAREGKPVNDVYAEMTAAIPSRTIGDPADFGAAAAFLASRQARYITGHNLLVDGGRYGGLL